MIVLFLWLIDVGEFLFYIGIYVDSVFFLVLGMGIGSDVVFVLVDVFFLFFFVCVI